MASVSAPEEIYAVIGNLMFSYGDEAQPCEKCHQFVENIVHAQLVSTLQEAKNCAKNRGCRRIECVDLLFLFRKHPVHLGRIYQMARSADLLRGFCDDYEIDCDVAVDVSSSSTSDDSSNSSSFETCGKQSQLVYDAVGIFDVTGELQWHMKNETDNDPEKRERLKRLAARTAKMNEAEYKNYTKARTMCGFCIGHNVKKPRIVSFLNWLGNPEIASNALIVLNYIATEMIHCLVEGALWSRQEEEAKTVLKSTQPPTPLQLRHYEEALRKNKAYRLGGNMLYGPTNYLLDVV